MPAPQTPQEVILPLGVRKARSGVDQAGQRVCRADAAAAGTGEPVCIHKKAESPADSVHGAIG